MVRKIIFTVVLGRLVQQLKSLLYWQDKPTHHQSSKDPFYMYCTLWASICLSFNSQQGPSLSSLSGRTYTEALPTTLFSPPAAISWYTAIQLHQNLVVFHCTYKGSSAWDSKGLIKSFAKCAMNCISRREIKALAKSSKWPSSYRKLVPAFRLPLVTLKVVTTAAWSLKLIRKLAMNVHWRKWTNER